MTMRPHIFESAKEYCGEFHPIDTESSDWLTKMTQPPAPEPAELPFVEAEVG